MLCLLNRPHLRNAVRSRCGAGCPTRTQVLIYALAVLALLLQPTQLWAQEKTLRIVLGYPPGASSDTLTRLLADRMRVLQIGRAHV